MGKMVRLSTEFVCGEHLQLRGRIWRPISTQRFGEGRLFLEEKGSITGEIQSNIYYGSKIHLVIETSILID
jgi:hypothetical protein